MFINEKPLNTSALKGSLEQQGYVHLRKVFSENFVQGLKKAAQRHLSPLDSSERRKVISLGSIIPVEKSVEITQSAVAPELIELLQNITGLAVHYHQGVVFSKPLGSPATFWHQDYYAWDEPIAKDANAGLYQLLIYLRKTTENTGALKVIPGSHRTWTHLHKKWKKGIAQCGSVDALTRKLRSFDSSYEWAYENYPEALSLSCHIGDAILIDSRLFHGACENNGLNERELITLFYLSGMERFSEIFKANLKKEVLGKINRSVSELYYESPYIPVYKGMNCDVMDANYKTKFPT